jgi:hypothetical protein
MATTDYAKRASNRRRRAWKNAAGGSMQGAKLQGRKPRPAGKGREAAEQALTDVLELFESGELPERIAQTVIVRDEQYDAPSFGWSLGNQLIMMLAGTADARGFRQWKMVGRHVSKGSRAFYILAPLTRKIHETDETTGEENERKIVSGFTGLPVFRFEDTEGARLEQPDYRPATYPPLFDVAQRFGLDVQYRPFVLKFRGYYTPSDHDGSERIVLCSHEERVFFHELAHAAHKRVRGDLNGGQDPKQEIVAETVAAVLCRLYGFDGYLYDGAEYVRSYAKGGNPAKAAIGVLGDVQKVLELILDTYGVSAAA